jgi:hypothetical protein
MEGQKYKEDENRRKRRRTNRRRRREEGGRDEVGRRRRRQVKANKYSSHNKTKEGQLDWTHIAQELPYKTHY